MSYETRIKRGVRPCLAKSLILVKVSCALSILILPIVWVFYGLMLTYPEITRELFSVWKELIEGD